MMMFLKEKRAFTDVLCVILLLSCDLTAIHGITCKSNGECGSGSCKTNCCVGADAISSKCTQCGDIRPGLGVEIVTSGTCAAADLITTTEDCDAAAKLLKVLRTGISSVSTTVAFPAGCSIQVDSRARFTLRVNSEPSSRNCDEKNGFACICKTQRKVGTCTSCSNGNFLLNGKCVSCGTSGTAVFNSTKCDLVKRDGEPCDNHAQCKSNTCHGGFCCNSLVSKALCQNCGPNPKCKETVRRGSNQVLYNGYLYKTHRSLGMDSNPSCQTSYASLGSYSLAPDEQDIIDNVVSCFKWGSNALVMANGNAYYTALGAIAGEKVLIGDMLQQSGSSYRGKQCYTQALFRLDQGDHAEGSGACKECNTLVSYMLSNTSCTGCNDGVAKTLPNGTCQVMQDVGSSCDYKEQCKSDSCKGNRCCDATSAKRTGCGACGASGECIGCVDGYYTLDGGKTCTACPDSITFKSNGKCYLKKKAGFNCTQATECLSGRCAGNRCCNSDIATDANCVECANEIESSSFVDALVRPFVLIQGRTGTLCPANLIPRNGEECKKAAERLQIPFNGFRTDSRTSIPSGCVLDSTSDTLIFNTATNRPCKVGFTCMCKISSVGACSKCKPTYYRGLESKCTSCSGSTFAFFNDKGVCERKAEVGETCTKDTACLSGTCKGGFCCNTDGKNSANCQECNRVPEYNTCARITDAISVVYGDYKYKTLKAGVTVSGTTASCQRTFLSVPSGWELVNRDNGTIQSVVKCSPWSTNGIVFKDGSVYGTNMNVSLGGVQLFANNGLLTESVISGDVYKPSSCHQQILIRKRLDTGSCSACQQGFQMLPDGTCSKCGTLGTTLSGSKCKFLSEVGDTCTANSDCKSVECKGNVCCDPRGSKDSHCKQCKDLAFKKDTHVDTKECSVVACDIDYNFQLDGWVAGLSQAIVTVVSSGDVDGSVEYVTLKSSTTTIQSCQDSKNCENVDVTRFVKNDGALDLTLDANQDVAYQTGTLTLVTLDVNVVEPCQVCDAGFYYRASPLSAQTCSRCGDGMTYTSTGNCVDRGDDGSSCTENKACKSGYIDGNLESGKVGACRTNCCKASEIDKEGCTGCDDKGVCNSCAKNYYTEDGGVTCVRCGDAFSHLDKDGNCITKKADGADCTADIDCISTKCKGGQCCNKEASGNIGCTACGKDNLGTCVGCDAAYYKKDDNICKKCGDDVTYIKNDTGICTDRVPVGSLCFVNDACLDPGTCRGTRCCNTEAANDVNCVSCSGAVGVSGSCTKCKATHYQRPNGGTQCRTCEDEFTYLLNGTCQFRLKPGEACLSNSMCESGDSSPGLCLGGFCCLPKVKSETGCLSCIANGTAVVAGECNKCDNTKYFLDVSDSSCQTCGTGNSFVGSDGLCYLKVNVGEYCESDNSCRGSAKCKANICCDTASSSDVGCTSCSSVPESILDATKSCEESNVVYEDTVDFRGWEYRLLTRQPVEGYVASCQSAPLPLPDGWERVDFSDEAVQVVSCYPWSSDTIAFKNGDSYYTGLAGLANAGLKAKSDVVLTEGSLFGVKQCNTQILLRRLSAFSFDLGGVCTACNRGFVFKQSDRSCTSCLTDPLYYQDTDGKCVAKGVPGDTCAADSHCLSSICRGGFCCDSSDIGPCESCGRFEAKSPVKSIQEQVCNSKGCSIMHTFFFDNWNAKRSKASLAFLQTFVGNFTLGERRSSKVIVGGTPFAVCSTFSPSLSASEDCANLDISNKINSANSVTIVASAEERMPIESFKGRFEIDTSIPSLGLCASCEKGHHLVGLKCVPCGDNTTYVVDGECFDKKAAGDSCSENDECLSGCRGGGCCDESIGDKCTKCRVGNPADSVPLCQACALGYFLEDGQCVPCSSDPRKYIAGDGACVDKGEPGATCSENKECIGEGILEQNVNIIRTCVGACTRDVTISLDIDSNWDDVVDGAARLSFQQNVVNTSGFSKLMIKNGDAEVVVERDCEFFEEWSASPGCSAVDVTEFISSNELSISVQSPPDITGLYAFRASLTLFIPSSTDGGLCKNNHCCANPARQKNCQACNDVGECVGCDKTRYLGLSDLNSTENEDDEISFMMCLPCGDDFSFKLSDGSCSEKLLGGADCVEGNQCESGVCLGNVCCISDNVDPECLKCGSVALEYEVLNECDMDYNLWNLAQCEDAIRQLNEAGLIEYAEVISNGTGSLLPSCSVVQRGFDSVASFNQQTISENGRCKSPGNSSQCVCLAGPSRDTIRMIGGLCSDCRDGNYVGLGNKCTVCGDEYTYIDDIGCAKRQPSGSLCQLDSQCSSDSCKGNYCCNFQAAGDNECLACGETGSCEKCMDTSTPLVLGPLDKPYTECNFTDTHTCLGNGVVRWDVASRDPPINEFELCKCESEFLGARCECITNGNNECQSCAPGFAGKTCEFNSLQSCNGNGIVDDSGTCDCEFGWTGSGCNVADFTVCAKGSGVLTSSTEPGTLKEINVCQCNPGFSGKQCECKGGPGDGTQCESCMSVNKIPFALNERGACEMARPVETTSGPLTKPGGTTDDTTESLLTSISASTKIGNIISTTSSSGLDDSAAAASSKKNDDTGVIAGVIVAFLVLCGLVAVALYLTRDKPPPASDLDLIGKFAAVRRGDKIVNAGYEGPPGEGGEEFYEEMDDVDGPNYAAPDETPVQKPSYVAPYGQDPEQYETPLRDDPQDRSFKLSAANDPPKRGYSTIQKDKKPTQPAYADTIIGNITHSPLSREESENILKVQGTWEGKFLIRRGSPKHGIGAYVLSICKKEKMFHHIISAETGGQYKCRNQVFESLIALRDHYKSKEDAPNKAAPGTKRRSGYSADRPTREEILSDMSKQSSSDVVDVSFDQIYQNEDVDGNHGDILI
eukprot:m.53165 g.53165  ORF g.53165 m.53165 type:complete len:2857 (+) comp10848_c0_seq1:153-8723(+)